MTIILDKELVDVAILGSSYARLLTTYHVHKDLDYDEAPVDDALRRLVDLKADVNAPALAKDMEDFDYQKENKKLKALLRAPNSTIVKNRTDLESHIDEHLEAEYKKNPTVDLKILFDWFDGVAPAQAAVPSSL